MSGIFSGLSKLGLSKIEGMDIFDKKEKVEKAEEETKHVEHIIEEEDMIYEKTYRCPVCDKEFKSKTVMSGKAKLESVDTDLRPKYQGIDCIKYDCVVCEHCGYGVLTRFFGALSSLQIRSIRENICDNFKGVKFGENTYSYDDAIVRYQLALANSVVKRAKSGERAYACLKLAWLYRGKAEQLNETDENYAKQIEECKVEEQKYIATAYEGFIKAVQEEYFPICGMDEATIWYLLADLARRNKKYDESARYISQILVSKSASPKVKDRARELKDILKEELKDSNN